MSILRISGVARGLASLVDLEDHLYREDKHYWSWFSYDVDRSLQGCIPVRVLFHEDAHPVGQLVPYVEEHAEHVGDPDSNEDIENLLWKRLNWQGIGAYPVARSGKGISVFSLHLD